MNKLKIKLKDKARKPTRAYEGDAGLDLYVREFSVLNNLGDTQVIYKTGVSVEIPDGFVGLLFPRSSVRDKSIRLSNSVGVIDSGYRGEIMATFDNIKSYTNIYGIGDKCCQLVIVPIVTPDVEAVDVLSESSRNNKGHGSSGE